MKVSEFSHRSGAEIIPFEMRNQILEVLRQTTLPVKKGGATAIRLDVISKLRSGGWSDEVHLDASSNITITGAKDGVGLCVQVGNISRLYADLLKLQTLFLRNSIKAGVILLPGHEAARALGQNIADSDRLERELNIFSSVISMPLWIVNFEEDGTGSKS